MVLTISNKGWVVIPAEMRKKYHLTPGSEVMIVDYGGVLAIVPAFKNPVEKGYGLLKGGASLTGTLKKERGFEKKREKRLLSG
jgi:AbrB family looped-hinge helix DNA binding protein